MAVNLLASMRYLVALHEHRHFGRAAQACHITQPALSNALRALEAEFGVAIVKRARTFAGLTHEGEAVLAAAHRMLHEHELLQQQLKSEEGRPRGGLRMAAVPTAMPLLTRFAVFLQARHPGIAPTVLSMSSIELETGLDSLAIDLALGYTDRMAGREVKLTAWPQTVESYFLVRRVGEGALGDLRRVAPTPWAEASRLPLCLLTPEMHNRSIVDDAFRQAGVGPVAPAIETNSVMTLALSVAAGTVAAVLPAGMLGALPRDAPLEASPLIEPEVRTPIGFMSLAQGRPSRALEAALGVLRSDGWAAVASGFNIRIGLGSKAWNVSAP